MSTTTAVYQYPKSESPQTIANRAYYESRAQDWLGALAISVMLVVSLAYYFDAELHWFMLPLILFGALVTKDVIAIFFGQLNLFDPLSVLSLVEFRVFISFAFTSLSNVWLKTANPPDDWRPWAGQMLLLNIACYGTMRASTFTLYRHFAKPVSARLITTSFKSNLIILLAISVIANVFVFTSLGGLSALSETEDLRSSFQATAVLLVLSECLPVLLFMYYAGSCLLSRKKPTVLGIATVILSLFILSIFSGGLRGSRTAVIMIMFNVIGICHFCLRPVRRKTLVLLLAAMAFFVYGYQFYKKFGIEGLANALQSSAERESMASSNRGEGAWYGRLVAGGTTTFTLYRLTEHTDQYEFAYGNTYLAGLARFVPKSIWPSRPVGKRKYGTEVLHGKGSWPRMETSLVWGLDGEAMLNFGPLAAPLPFLILGFIVAFTRRSIENWPAFDPRRMLIPLILTWIIFLRGSDSEQLPFQIIKTGFLPFVAVYIGSIKIRRRNPITNR